MVDPLFTLALEPTGDGPFSFIGELPVNRDDGDDEGIVCAVFDAILLLEGESCKGSVASTTATSPPVPLDLDEGFTEVSTGAADGGRDGPGTGALDESYVLDGLRAFEDVGELDA